MVLANDLLGVHDVNFVGTNAGVQHGISNHTVAEFEIHDEKHGVDDHENREHRRADVNIERQRRLGRSKPENGEDEQQVTSERKACIPTERAHETEDRCGGNDGQLHDVGQSEAAREDVPHGALRRGDDVGQEGQTDQDTVNGDLEVLHHLVRRQELHFRNQRPAEEAFDETGDFHGGNRIFRNGAARADLAGCLLAGRSR